jgi:hypothetical protein
MKMYRGIISILLVFSQLLYTRLNVLDSEPRDVEFIGIHKMQYCYISFVKINGKIYLIKQKKINHFDQIVGVVRDAIAAHIAEIFDRNMANHVDIIPAGKNFPGKLYISWPATIHTLAPGKMVLAQWGAYRKMNIKQGFIGFRRDMLSWMAKHTTLIKIVVLDTFVCNNDRHQGNLFYDPKRNWFCAIDMDSSYKHNLCAMACKNFMGMINDRNLRLRDKELYALIEYKKYLDFLIKTFRPEDIVDMYDYFAHKAGFVEGSHLYKSSVGSELRRNKTMIVQSYNDAKRLTIIVGDLINKAQKNRRR